VANGLYLADTNAPHASLTAPFVFRFRCPQGHQGTREVQGIRSVANLQALHRAVEQEEQETEDVVQFADETIKKGEEE
jgi:hypothetical protein